MLYKTAIPWGVAIWDPRDSFEQNGFALIDAQCQISMHSGQGFMRGRFLNYCHFFPLFDCP